MKRTWADALRRAAPTPADDPVQQYRTEHLLMQHINTPPSRGTSYRRITARIAVPAALTACALFVALPDAARLEPIRIGGTPNATSKIAESAYAGNAASDMRLAAPIEFRLAPGVELRNEDRRVYRFAEASVTDVERLADRLGATAPLEQVSYPSGETTYSTTDGLYASSNGSFSWSNMALYNSPEFQSRMTVSCAVEAVPPSTDGAMPIPEPVDASPLVPCGPETDPQITTRPSDTAALAAITPLIGSAKATVSYRSAYSVSFTLTYDAVDADAYTGYAEVADLGVLGVAGMFTEIEKMGKYPTATVDEALQRFTDQGFATARAYIEPAPALGAPETSVSCLPPAPSAEAPSVALTPADDPSLVGPCVQPEPAPIEPIVVELTAVAWSSTILYDTASRIWVVPAYEFTATDGSRYTAIALTAAYLEQVTPPPVMDLVDPVPAVGDTDTSAPEPDSALVDTTPFTGLTEDAATALAANLGLEIRVVARDGEEFAVTRDYRTTRVNIRIVDGTVTEASIG
jgi:hypothetical protein